MKIQINDEIRDATPEEIARIEEIQKTALEEKQQKEKLLALRQSVLEKLGLTEEEIGSLLG